MAKGMSWGDYALMDAGRGNTGIPYQKPEDRVKILVSYGYVVRATYDTGIPEWPHVYHLALPGDLSTRPNNFNIFTRGLVR